MKKEVKVIFHIDLNAFFATVAQINEPYLKNKVFAVGGSSMSGRGVLTTSSYKARALGIKAGMPVSDAIRIYPKIAIVPLDFPEYRKHSNIFFNFLSNYSTKMLKGSIDEAYLDVTELAKTRNGLDIAKEIQDRLNKEYGLPVSIGIAPTLFLAKMASDIKKPLGITVVRRKDIISKILPLPIKDLFGMGIKTYPLMEKIGVKTLGDFVIENNKERILEYMKEETYQSYINHILGNSTDIINMSRFDIPQSISSENTLNYGINSEDVLLEEITNLFKRSYNSLIKDKLLAKTVNIKIRTTDFNTITRSKTLIDYTDNYIELENIMVNLFYDNYDDEPIRLIGAGFSNIITKDSYKEEYNLFTYQKLLKD